MRRFAPIFATVIGLGASGCVLAESADNYPFTPLIVINTDEGNNGSNNEPDMSVDMAPPPAPELIFTELLIATSLRQATLGDRGEYIEIKNVGEGPADPQRIVMLLTDPTDGGTLQQRIQVALPATAEEREVVGSLEQIQPGEYFVFVRFETEIAPISEVTAPGLSYDFGVYAGGPTLSNQAARQLELTYSDPRTPEPFDTVRWQAGRLVAPDGGGEGLGVLEDIALVLDVGAEDSVSNDDPKQWCVGTETFGTDGTTLGSPGSASICD